MNPAEGSFWKPAEGSLLNPLRALYGPAEGLFLETR